MGEIRKDNVLDGFSTSFRGVLGRFSSNDHPSIRGSGKSGAYRTPGILTEPVVHHTGMGTSTQNSDNGDPGPKLTELSCQTTHFVIFRGEYCARLFASSSDLHDECPTFPPRFLIRTKCLSTCCRKQSFGSTPWSTVMPQPPY